MITMKNIVREGNTVLRAEAMDVTLPVPLEDQKTMFDMFGYLINSQDEAKAKEFGLRPGVGLAAPQIGVSKKMFAILCNDIDGEQYIILAINPKINKTGKKMVYLPGGEGCLSVDRETCGVVPRYADITASLYMYNFKQQRFELRTLKLSNYVSIVFQHEYDHLFGTLFVDKCISEEEALSKGIKPLWEETEE